MELETWDHTEPQAHVENEDLQALQVLLVLQGCLENQDRQGFKVLLDLLGVEV